jgi:hypothetical protein
MDGKADIYSRSFKISSNCSLAFYPRRKSARGKNAAPETVFADKEDSLFVMAGLVPAIHVFLAAAAIRRGCPGQARA